MKTVSGPPSSGNVATATSSPTTVLRTGSLRGMSGVLLAGLLLSACERGPEAVPTKQATAPASKGTASVLTTDATNILPLGHYRAHDLIKNEPTVVVVKLDKSKFSTNLNTPEVSAALDKAIAQYNALNLNIKFSRTSAGVDNKVTVYFTTVYNLATPPKPAPFTLSPDNYTTTADETKLLAGSRFPVEVSGTNEPGRVITLNRAAAQAAGPNVMTNLLLKELGHVIGIENTDPKGQYLPDTEMINIQYRCNDLLYTKNGLNGNPVLVPGTAASTPDVTSVFSICGPTYGTAPAQFNAQDKAVLVQLFGKK